MANEERWARLYYSLDCDHSGDLTMADTKNGLAKFCRLNEIKEGTPEYQNAAASYDAFWGGFMKDTDLNKDGVVTKAEFDETFRKIASGGRNAIPKWWADNIAQVFNSIDANANGELDFDEFKAYAKKAAPQAAEADVQQAFEWAKKVTHKEFIDQSSYQDLLYIWVASPDPHPEFDIIFAYWN